MKVVIDIPEDYYDALKQISDESSTADMLIIKYGTPIPDNATNQNVLDAVFPYGYADSNNIEWCNALYKSGGAE